MKYKNRLKKLEARIKFYETIKNKTGYTKPGSQKK
jgi:hypothetical protein